VQTTLRIDDPLYREAKVQAAREGITLTRFLEESIRLRLKQGACPPPEPHTFRVWDGKVGRSPTGEEIQRIADEKQESHDLANLGVGKPYRFTWPPMVGACSFFRDKAVGLPRRRLTQCLGAER